MPETLAERLKRIGAATSQPSPVSAPSLAERLSRIDSPQLGTPATGNPVLGSVALDPISIEPEFEPVRSAPVGIPDSSPVISEPVQPTAIQQNFGAAVAGLPPDQQARVIASQNDAPYYSPVGDSSPVERTAVEFVSPVIDMVGGVPARILGADQPTLAQSLPAPRTREEAIARGVSGILGEGASYVVPSGPMAAAKLAGAGAKALGANKALQLGAGIIGFGTPVAAADVVSGNATLGEAALHTATSPVTLPYDVARSAVGGGIETARALSNPQSKPEQITSALETLKPAAAIALPAALHRGQAKAQERANVQAALIVAEKPVVPAVQSAPAVPTLEAKRAAQPTENISETLKANEAQVTAKANAAPQGQKGQGLLVAQPPGVAETGVPKVAPEAPGGPSFISVLKKHFPGSSPSEVSIKYLDGTETGYSLTLPNGTKLIVEPNRKRIVFDKERAASEHGVDVARVKGASGKYKSQADLKQEGLGVIELLEGAKEGTLTHEKLHALMDLVLSKDQKADILKRFGTEERAAEAFRRHEGYSYGVMDKAASLLTKMRSVISGNPFKEISNKESILADVAKAGKEKVTSTARRLFTSKGDLPDEVFKAKLDRDAKIQEQSKDVEFAVRDFDKGAKELFGSPRRMPQEVREAVDAAFKGEEGLHRIPEQLQGPVTIMRDKVDAMSRKLIDSGAVEGELVPTIEKNLGFYAKRSYRVFDDPKWAQKVPVEVRNKAKALLRSEYPDRSPAEIDGLIESLLYEGKAAESPIDVLRKGSKLGAKDLSILTHRKDIAPEIRALWGEYSDARVNYARSVESMSRLMANHEFLTTVKNQGLGKFFHEKPIVDKTGEYKTRIAAEASDFMYPLNGLYTTPEIKTAFESAMKPKQYSGLLAAYMKINGAVKYNKTVASLQTHIRNFIGNLGFAVANGHWRVWKAGAVGKALGSDLGTRRKFLAKVGIKDTPEGRDYVKKLTRLGIIDEGVNAGEMREVIAESMRGQETFADKYTASLARRGLNKMTKAYQVGDYVWKIYGWENEVARYRKAFPKEPIESIEKRAAEIVRNTYPTYSMVPEGFKWLRRFPLTGPFVSFPAEVARVGWHTLTLAAKELKDPATRSIGAERLAGIVGASTLTTAIAAWTRHINGISRDEDEDLRQFMPPWSQNSQIAYTNKSGDGKVRYVDIGYTDPWNYLKNPVVALMRGENWEDALTESVKEAFAPFFGEEILAGKVLDLLRNKTPSGGQVYNEQASSWDKFKKKVEHLYEAIEPGTITSANRIIKGIKGETSAYGQSFDPVLESVAVFSGHRLTTLDARQSLSFKARQFARSIPEATALLTVPLTRRGTVQEGEIEEGAKSSASARSRLFTDMTRNISAARRLGVTDREIAQILSSSGVSRVNVPYLMRGQTPPMKISKQTAERALQAPGGQDRIKALRNQAQKPRQ